MSRRGKFNNEGIEVVDVHQTWDEVNEIYEEHEVTKHRKAKENIVAEYVKTKKSCHRGRHQHLAVLS